MRVAYINPRTASRQLRLAETWDFGDGPATSAASAHTQLMSRRQHARSTAVQASPDSTASRELPVPSATFESTDPSIRLPGGAGTRARSGYSFVSQCTNVHHRPLDPESPTKLAQKAGAESGPRLCTRISAVHPRHHRHVADLDPMLSCVPDTAHRRASKAGARLKRCAEAFCRC